MFTNIPENSRNYTIILLRHAQSVGNANGYHQGQSNFPLTDTGRSQAQALAERWQHSNQRFDVIISSPLARANETAQIIAAKLGSSLENDPVWMERNVGLLSGMRPEDAQKIYPRPDFIDPYQAIGQTGESQWELFLRAGQAVQSILQRKPGTILVVSHGGILNMVMYAILGIIPHANFYGPRFRFGNTAFATLTYTPAIHRWAVHGLNDHQHWLNDEG